MRSLNAKQLRSALAHTSTGMAEVADFLENFNYDGHLVTLQPIILETQYFQHLEI